MRLRFWVGNSPWFLCFAQFLALWAANIEKSATSEGHHAMVLVNVKGLLKYTFSTHRSFSLCTKGDPGIFDRGGGVQTSERTVKLFCGKLLLTEMTLCFSICECRLLLVWEYCFASRGKQTLGGYPKIITFLSIPRTELNFVKKTQPVNKWYTLYDPVDVRISVSNKHQVW